MSDQAVGIAYRQHELDENWDAIVVGSGIGGLTAAALLARHGGKRVLVLERHYTAGGFTHVFRRPGFEWDVGVHYIGGVRDTKALLRRIFDHLTEGRLEWGHMPDVYDRIFLGDGHWRPTSGSAAGKTHGGRNAETTMSRSNARYRTGCLMCSPGTCRRFRAESLTPSSPRPFRHGILPATPKGRSTGLPTLRNDLRYGASGHARPCATST